MAAPAAVWAAKVAVQVAASDKGRKVIGSIVIGVIALVVAPILLVTSFFSTLAGWVHLDPPESPYRQAEQLLIHRLSVENTLDVQTVKVIDLLYHEEIDENPERIAELVESHFLKTVTIGVGEDAVTLTYFMNALEMAALLPLPPFRFDADKMEAFLFLSTLDFFLSSSNGGNDTGGGGSGESVSFTGQYPMPLEQGTITSGYGSRTGAYSGFHDEPCRTVSAPCSSDREIG